MVSTIWFLLKKANWKRKHSHISLKVVSLGSEPLIPMCKTFSLCGHFWNVLTPCLEATIENCNVWPWPILLPRLGSAQALVSLSNSLSQLWLKNCVMQLAHSPFPSCALVLNDLGLFRQNKAHSQRMKHCYPKKCSKHRCRKIRRDSNWAAANTSWTTELPLA